MSKSIKFLLFALIFIFIGYEYPIIIDNSKKYAKFYLKKMGIINNFVSNKQDIDKIQVGKKEDITKQVYEIQGNSFDLNYEKIINFDNKTANFFLNVVNNNKLIFDIYLQNGINVKNNFTGEINLPIDISFEKNGGVKSVLKINNKSFALISNKKNFDCYYASIINLQISKKIFSTDCLPDFDETDFNGIGGAYLTTGNDLFLSVGAPEWNSEKIRKLAQDPLSKYGKIIKFDKKSFLDEKILKINYEIFSKGHKNPQGMVLVDNKIFSVEHGPQGGDEINLIKEGMNYGWPITSYGTRYGDGKSFKKKDQLIESPIFSFIPSIAPSSINKCPKNLENYYIEDHCFLLLSLRGMSVFVVLIDKKNLNLISLEQFKVDQRLRHFGLNDKNSIFQKDNSFYISVDGEGIYKMKFDKFR